MWTLKAGISESADLLGHGVVPQGWVLEVESSEQVPPSDSTVSLVRVASWVSVPQVTGHALHAPHSPITQSTGIGKYSQEARVLMHKLSYLTEAVLSNKRNQLALSFDDSPREPFGQRSKV